MKIMAEDWVHLQLGVLREYILVKTDLMKREKY